MSDTKAIPKDHPYRREFARMEREFGDALTTALNKWRRALFRDITDTNVHALLTRLDDPDTLNILQDVMVAQLQTVAGEGVDKARQQIEREVYGVR